MLVLEEKEAYRLAYVSLVRDQVMTASDDAPWLWHVYASYRPVAQTQWLRVARYGDEPMEAALAQQVWHSETFARYRRFALFPAVYRVQRERDFTCVWFNDLRFALVGRTMPFRYGACRDGAQAAWRVYRLITDGDGREVRDGIR
jgi:inner membrane protein